MAVTNSTERVDNRSYPWRYTKRPWLLLPIVFLPVIVFTVLAYRVTLSSSADLVRTRQGNIAKTNFPELAAAFLRIHNTNVSAGVHRGRLVRESVHIRLIPFLIASQHPAPIFVIQVGSNIGEEFKKGVSTDDPVVAAVVNRKAKGILIEPVPSNFNMLARNAAPYGNRFLCINAAIVFTEQSKNVPFYAVDESRVRAEFRDAPEWFTSQIGSFDKSHLVKHFHYLRTRWRRRHDIDYYIKKIYVKTLMPQRVLDRLHSQYPESLHAELSMLHVDAEGLDWSIVVAFLERVTPNVIIFEHKHMKRISIARVMRILQARGYFPWVAGQNLYAMQVGLQRALAYNV